MAAMANLQSSMTEEVKSRLLKAAEEIGEKYESGSGGQDVSVDGPSGAAYKEKQAQEAQKKKAAAKRREAQAEAQRQEEDRSRVLMDDEEEEEDADYELRLLRDSRLQQIKTQHKERLDNLGKGHGQYREIVQDEFLAEVTSSLRVVCHFYHGDFPRCNIIDHHIQRLVGRHVETKFIKINAEKAPFFTEKLTIRTIPTLVLFFDGVAKDKIIGFEGLADRMPPGKEDEWPTIVLARLLAAKMAINEDAVVDDDEVEAAQKARADALRMQGIRESLLTDFTDDDLNLDD